MQYAACNGCELECVRILGGKKCCIFILFCFTAMGRVKLCRVANADLFQIFVFVVSLYYTQPICFYFNMILIRLLLIIGIYDFIGIQFTF